MRPRGRPPVVTHIISGDIWAGAEAQAFQLLDGLRDNGLFIPTAVVFNRGRLMDKLSNRGIPVTCADETRLSPFGIVRTIGAHLRQNQTRIVHTHGFKENVLGTLAQKLSGTPRSVRTIHGNPETAVTWRTPRRKLTDLLDQLTGRFGQDAIIAVSSQLEAHLAALYPGKTEKIYNFIDLANVERRSDENALAVSKQNDTKTLGIVGRLVPVKRVDLFIDAIGLLHQQLPFSVGGVVIGDGPLLSDLRAQVSRRGLDGVIEFKGFVEDTATELRKLDVLLMTSDHEGLPMVLLEALAQKVPVIAHNVGGIPEALNHGHAGVLVNDHNAEGYAGKAAKLLQAPEIAFALTENGFRHLEAQFSRQRNVEKYQNLYARLCSHTVPANRGLLDRD